MCSNKEKNNQKGFTLLELLVAIVIIGVISGIVMVSLSGSRDKANVSKLLVFSNTMRGQLADSLISYWSFNEGSGTTTRDAWLTNNGELKNFNFDSNSGWRSGGDCVSGGCLRFDGVNDYVEFGNDSSLNLTGPLSIEFWLKIAPGASVQGQILSKNLTGLADNQYGFYYDLSWGVIYTNLNGSNRIWPPGDSIMENKWYHIVLTYDLSNLIFYTNGLKVKQEEYSDSITPTDFTLNLGRRKPDDKYFNGLIDEFHIYSSAADIAEIQKQYVKGLDSLLSNKSITQEEYDERIAKLEICIVQK